MSWRNKKVLNKERSLIFAQNGNDYLLCFSGYSGVCGFAMQPWQRCWPWGGKLLFVHWTGFARNFVSVNIICSERELHSPCVCKSTRDEDHAQWTFIKTKHLVETKHSSSVAMICLVLPGQDRPPQFHFGLLGKYQQRFDLAVLSSFETQLWCGLPQAFLKSLSSPSKILVLVSKVHFEPGKRDWFCSKRDLTMISDFLMVCREAFLLPGEREETHSWSQRITLVSHQRSRGCESK